MVKKKNSYQEFTREKAVKLISFLGNDTPNETQLNVVEQLIKYWVIRVPIHFEDCLSSQETNCLWYAAKGFSVEYTAKILGTSEGTVKKQRKSILRKLDCNSMIEAIGKIGFIASDIKLKDTE